MKASHRQEILNPETVGKKTCKCPIICAQSAVCMCRATTIQERCLKAVSEQTRGLNEPVAFPQFAALTFFYYGIPFYTYVNRGVSTNSIAK